MDTEKKVKMEIREVYFSIKISRREREKEEITVEILHATDGDGTFMSGGHIHFRVVDEVSAAKAV